MISGAPNKHGIFHQRDLGVGGGEEEDTTRDKFLNSGDRQMDLLGFGKTSQCSGDGGSSTVPALGRLNEEEDWQRLHGKFKALLLTVEPIKIGK